MTAEAEEYSVAKRPERPLQSSTCLLILVDLTPFSKLCRPFLRLSNRLIQRGDSTPLLGQAEINAWVMPTGKYAVSSYDSAHLGGGRKSTTQCYEYIAARAVFRAKRTPASGLIRR
jgi:hypothetical protein